MHRIITAYTFNIRETFLFLLRHIFPFNTNESLITSRELYELYQPKALYSQYRRIKDIFLTQG